MFYILGSQHPPGPMNRPLTISAGPLNCQLSFGDHVTEKTVRKRYGKFLTNTPSKNVLKILPSSNLLPGKEEFNLRLRGNEERFQFFSSSTDGYFDPALCSGLVNIAINRLDNPATIENALRYLFAILALNQSRELVFVHGAAFSRGDKAWIFLGPSGSGKSTVASLARKRGYRVLSDDLFLLGRGAGDLFAFSSPFYGQVRGGTGHHESFPVAGMCFLNKSGHDVLSPIDSLPTKVALLLANVPFLERCDTHTMNRILNIAEYIGEKIRMYRMEFTHSPKFLDLLESEYIR